MIELAISAGGLRGFVVDILKKTNEEKETQSHWEMWLHFYLKRSDGKLSFADYLKKAKASNKGEGKTLIKNRAKLDEGISKSYEILKGFKPH